MKAFSWIIIPWARWIWDWGPSWLDHAHPMSASEKTFFETFSQSVLPKRCHKIRERKKRPCWTREKDRMCRVELHGTDGLIGLKTDQTEEVQSIWVWFRCYMMIFISVISCPLKFNSCQILSSQRGNEQMKLKFLGAKPKHAVYKELMH